MGFFNALRDLCFGHRIGTLHLRAGSSSKPIRNRDNPHSAIAAASLPDRSARTAAADGRRRRAASAARLGVFRRSHRRRQPARHHRSLVRRRRGRHDAQSRSRSTATSSKTASPKATCSSTRPPAASARFDYGGLSIVSANGFTVNSVTVVDGGSQIVFDLSGFDAGEKLVFSVDADEAQFIDGNDVDVNSLVEGAEFQRSIMVGEFSADRLRRPHAHRTYWDAFDDEFAAAHSRDRPHAATCRTTRTRRRTTTPTARPAPWLTRRRFRWPRSPAGSITTAATTACSIAARSKASAA